MAKIIILIGKTGSGKSTLANVISGTNEFIESGSSASVTKEIKKGEFSNSGISYAVIDTVGIGDTQLEKEKVLDKIAEAVYLAKDGISQVLFVTNGRFDQFEMSIYSLLSTIIFDKSVTDYTTIVRTKFPEFEREKNRQKDIEEMMTSEGDLSNIIKTCQQRVIHIDNPSLDVEIPDDESDGEREEREELIDLKKKIRNKSQKKLLEHLQKICLKQKEDYKPEKLKKLSAEIADYMKKKIESKMRLAEREEEKRKKLEEARKKEEEIKKSVVKDSKRESENISSEDKKEKVSETTEKEEQTSKDDDQNPESFKKALTKLRISSLESELKGLEETKKLIEGIQEAEGFIRQKVLNHIFHSYNEITQVVGGSAFINNIIGSNNDFSDLSKLSLAEIQKQKEELEEKLLEKGNDNQSLDEIKDEINQKEQKLLDSKKELLTIKEIAEKWQKQGFSIQQAKEWAEVLGKSFSPEDDIDFCVWLRDNKEINYDYEETIIINLHKDKEKINEEEVLIAERFHDNKSGNLSQINCSFTESIQEEQSFTWSKELTLWTSVKLALSFIAELEIGGQVEKKIGTSKIVTKTETKTFKESLKVGCAPWKKISVKLLAKKIEVITPYTANVKRKMMSGKTYEYSIDGEYFRDDYSESRCLTEEVANVRNILLVGWTGSGKSTLAKVLSGDETFEESDGKVSKTKFFRKSDEFKWKENNYCVIDNIGFGDTNISEREILIRIGEAINSAYQGLSHVLFVFSGRFSDKEKEGFGKLAALKITNSYITLVRSKFDNFYNEDECKEDEELLKKESPEISKLFDNCRGILHIDNGDEDSRDESREKVLDYLNNNCTDNPFKPKEWDDIASLIDNYLQNKAKLEKEKDQADVVHKEEIEQKIDNLKTETAVQIKEKVKGEEIREFFETIEAVKK